MEVEKKKEEYIQMRAPDTSRLAELLTRAKGPDRTMAQYAAACALSASMLSRIVNGKIVKSISQEILIKLYENQDPSAGIPFPAFLAANGMIEKTKAEEHRALGDYFEKHNQRLNRENMMKNIVTGALFDRGVPIQRTLRNWRLETGTDGEIIYPFKIGDFSVDASGGLGASHWVFFLYPFMIDDRARSRRYPDGGIMRQFIQKYGEWFLLDAWSEDMLPEFKISFVFCDSRIFDRFIEFMSDKPIKQDLSGILVDLESGLVVRESWPGRNSDGESIFNTPPTTNDEDEGEYEDEELYGESKYDED